MPVDEGVEREAETGRDRKGLILPALIKRDHVPDPVLPPDPVPVPAPVPISMPDATIPLPFSLLPSSSLSSKRLPGVLPTDFIINPPISLSRFAIDNNSLSHSN